MNTALPPIDFKDGLDLLGRLGLIEFAIESCISGDPASPLTSSAAMRQNLTHVLSDAARSLDELAAKIDPLKTESPKS
jgi:hypothetical protein